MAIWNPWHGCHKISPGCANCYVYRRDESIGKDAFIVTKTGDYNLPLKKNRQGQYKLTTIFRAWEWQRGLCINCRSEGRYLNVCASLILEADFICRTGKRYILRKKEWKQSEVMQEILCPNGCQQRILKTTESRRR